MKQYCGADKHVTSETMEQHKETLAEQYGQLKLDEEQFVFLIMLTMKC